MDYDTPLTEVAHHLPAYAAEYLGQLEEDLQSAVLACVRTYVVGLEKLGVELDPVQYEGVIGMFVSSVAGLLSETTKLAGELGRLRAEKERRRR